MATEAQDFAALARLTPAEAVAHLKQRGQLTKTFAWQDLWQDEHSHQFTVSRLARLDLLEGIRDQITRSVAGDLSRRDFMRDAQQLLQDAGWWGEKTVTDPATGKDVTTTFDPARLKLIFDTNTRMAYAAGQWERVERTKKTHPYLRYITQRDERVRASHRAWDNVTLPVDHAFWTTHYPPNGWRCRCRVVALSRREYERGQAPGGVDLVKKAPPVVMRDWIDRRTGEIRQIPAGIDPGFGYNVGAASARARELQKLVSEKLQAADPQLADAARNDGLAPWHARASNAAASADFARRALAVPKVKQPARMLGPVSADAVQRAQAFELVLTGKQIALDHDGVIHTLREHGDASSEAKRGQVAVTPEDLASFHHLFNLAVIRPGDPPLASDGSKRVEGEVTVGGMTFHLVALVRRAVVVPLTMWKRPQK